MDNLLEGKLKFFQGDITELEVDAIVNAANSSLMGGGGVDGAIHRRGGPEILEECKELIATRFPGGLPTGQAVMTGSGRLPCNYVIHTVGPVWHGGKKNEEALLTAAYENSLRLAAEHELKIIAFPALSTGVYGFPRTLAAVIAYKTIEIFLSHNQFPEEVQLVFFSQPDLETFRTAVKPFIG